MSVHLEISKKVNQTVSLVESYRRLDKVRESEIEKVVKQAMNGEEFTLEAINQVTAEINQLAAKHHLPSRKMVTKQMIIDFINQG